MYLQNSRAPLSRGDGIRSEKCIVRRFHRCVNTTAPLPNLGGLAYRTPGLQGAARCS